MSDIDQVVIPLPTSTGAIIYAVARLVREGNQAFAEAIVAIPDTTFAPPKRVELSRYSLAQIKPGAAMRPNLYLYEGMIMPAPPLSPMSSCIFDSGCSCPSSQRLAVGQRPIIGPKPGSETALLMRR